jgi:ceramide glucosyltransferase
MALGLSMIWWAALALSAAACAYRLLALWAVATWRPVSGEGWPDATSVTVLKPLCGLEDGLEAALASFLGQQTSQPLRFVFGAAQADDPALALARKLVDRFPDCTAEFVVDSALHGPNRKVSNLVNMAQRGLGDLVVISDSDIVIPPGALQAAINALSAEGIGGVTSLYRGRPGIAGSQTRTFGAWYLDYWSLPMAALHARLGGLDVTYGPLTIVRGDVLRRGGGLKSIAAQLCDDAALGRLVLAQGMKLGFAPLVVETLVNDAGPRDLFAHELRWSRTDRGEHSIGNLATMVSHPGPLPLLLLLQPGWIAAFGIALPVLLRWALARLVEERFGRADSASRIGFLGVILRDLACFGVWLAGLTVSSVEWRGQRLTVGRGGVLESGQ